MAVQQNKKSPSRRGMRRSHHRAGVATLAVDSVTGDKHLRHHISPEGNYRGHKVRDIGGKDDDDE